MTAIPNLGPDASIGDILVAQPGRFGPIIAFAQDVMRGQGSIDPADRELLAAFVSALNDCSLCHGIHTATARRYGVDQSLLETLLGDPDSPDVRSELRPVFAFARKLVLEPSKVTDADRRSVLATGLDKALLDDVIAIVSLFSFFNRLVDGHGVQGNQDIFDRDSEMLFSFGYAPPTA